MTKTSKTPEEKLVNSIVNQSVSWEKIIEKVTRFSRKEDLVGELIIKINVISSDEKRKDIRRVIEDLCLVLGEITVNEEKFKLQIAELKRRNKLAQDLWPNLKEVAVEE